MKRHRLFELFVADNLKKNGYTTSVTSAVGDWGADAFCEKDGKKYVVQDKMFGDCRTKVNRRMMMELYGVMRYFDCDSAILVYNGKITPDAIEVAHKLDIKLVFLDQRLMDDLYAKSLYSGTKIAGELSKLDFPSFEIVWNEIQKLCSRQITNSRGTSYKIIDVTEGDISYTNEAGVRHKESIDLFRMIYHHICDKGYIQQNQMRNNFGTRASAFISTIFANIPSFIVKPNPTTITIKQ